MFELFTKFRNSVIPARYQLTVESEVLFNTETEEFIVVYGHMENVVKNVGNGERLAEAFKEVAKVVESSSHSSQEKVNQSRSHGEKTSLELNVYHSDRTSEYIVTLSDNDKFIESSGRNIADAFAEMGSLLN